jgi:hypothetical protein
VSAGAAFHVCFHQAQLESVGESIHTSARTALGLERAEKLIMFCFIDRCLVADQNDFYLLLETVENQLTDEVDEGAVEAVTGLREAASW